MAILNWCCDHSPSSPPSQGRRRVDTKLCTLKNGPMMLLGWWKFIRICVQAIQKIGAILRSILRLMEAKKKGTLMFDVPDVGGGGGAWNIKAIRYWLRSSYTHISSELLVIHLWWINLSRLVIELILLIDSLSALTKILLELMKLPPQENNLWFHYSKYLFGWSRASQCIHIYIHVIKNYIW